MGAWSDRFGRKPILLLTHLGTLISWIFFLSSFFIEEFTIFNLVDHPLFGTALISLPLIILFLARSVDGITGGNVSVANAYLADISTDENRTKNFSYMAISANIGFIIGPALAGLLGNTQFGLLLPVFVAILISFIGLLLIIFLLKDKTNPNGKKFDSELGKEKKRLKASEIVKLPHISFLLSMNFLVFLGFNFFYISFPVFVILELGWNELALGFLLSFLSVCMVLVQGPVLSQLSKKISPGSLILIGSPILAIGFILVIFRDVPLIYFSAVLIALGNGLMYPSLVATISKHAGNDNQGVVQGLAGSSGSLASIIGLLVGGILYTLILEKIFFLSFIFIITLSIMSLKFVNLEKTHVNFAVCNHDFLKKANCVEELCDVCSAS
jgi:MFS family permease